MTPDSTRHRGPCSRRGRFMLGEKNLARSVDTSRAWCRLVSMNTHEITTATINRSAVVHYVYTVDGFTYSLCNGERMGYQRIARPTKDAATCKRCLKAHA